MRKSIKFFVSYAQRNQGLATRFIDHFLEYAEPSIKYSYKLWRDTTDILVGDNWDEEIKQALEQCDIGLLLISVSFLGSSYIANTELKSLRRKPVVPMLLAPVDFELHDLKGLKEKQIFRLENKNFQAPKSYSECSAKQRDQFVLKFFRQVERKLDRLNL